MKVNGNINFTGNLTVQGRDIKTLRDDHYELGLILIRGLLGGGYIGGSVWTTITTLKFATDAWGTSANSINYPNKYGGWASAHTHGYFFLNGQNGYCGNDKVNLATEIVTAIGNRTYCGGSPSTIQQGVGYESTGVPFGTKAYTCGNDSTGYDKFTFATDTFVSTTDANAPTRAHTVGWFDREYGYHYSTALNRTSIYPYASETWRVQSTTNTPGGFGMPGNDLEKGVNSKKGKFYLAGTSSWINNTIFQYRNTISTWTTNFGSQSVPNCETAGVMGQNHGYLAGGYQTYLGQNAISDKVKYDTDTITSIADAPRSLSSASPIWSPI
jgi:hypothetical protein